MESKICAALARDRCLHESEDQEVLVFNNSTKVKLLQTELTNLISTILGRAAVDLRVGPKAMEMLRYYGVDYEYIHGQYGGADFDEAVKHFATPPNDIQDVLTQWDGEKPQVLKAPFDSATHEMQCRILEQNFSNLTSEAVKTYWYALNEAILRYRKTSEEAAT